MPIIYGHTCDPAGPVAPPGTFRMVHGTRAFFGYTTSPDGRTFWFCQCPGSPYTQADLDKATHAQWQRTALEHLEFGPSEALNIVLATGQDIAGNQHLRRPLDRPLVRAVHGVGQRRRSCRLTVGSARR